MKVCKQCGSQELSYNPFDKLIVCMSCGNCASPLHDEELFLNCPNCSQTTFEEAKLLSLEESVKHVYFCVKCGRWLFLNEKMEMV